MRIIDWSSDVCSSDLAALPIWSMVRARLRNDVIERRHGAGLRIERAEYQTADARVDDGAGAHHAGFERHVQRRISEPVIAKGLRRRAHRQHFSEIGRANV